MHHSQQKIALEEIITLWERDNYAADSVFRRYYKGRRYIGARDRRILQSGFYCYLRYKISIDEWALQYETINRADIAFYLSGGGEQNADMPDMPELPDLQEISPDANMPDFLYQQLQNLPDSIALIQAMQQQAPITLRCESQDDVDKLYHRLLADNIEVTKGNIRPLPCM